MALKLETIVVWAPFRFNAVNSFAFIALFNTHSRHPSSTYCNITNLKGIIENDVFVRGHRGLQSISDGMGLSKFFHSPAMDLGG